MTKQRKCPCRKMTKDMKSKSQNKSSPQNINMLNSLAVREIFSKIKIMSYHIPLVQKYIFSFLKLECALQLMTFNSCCRLSCSHVTVTSAAHAHIQWLLPEAWLHKPSVFHQQNNWRKEYESWLVCENLVLTLSDIIKNTPA